MNTINVAHEKDGWHYEIPGEVSPPYPSRAAAEAAAKRALAGRDEATQKGLESELERGLTDTFPASDPVAVTQPVDAGGPHDRKKS